MRRGKPNSLARLKIGIAVLVSISCAGLIGYMWPIWAANLTQDECSFDGVSREEYKSIEADIRKNVSGELGPVKGRLREYLTDEIAARVHRGLEGRRSLAEKVAAIHAVMRNLGAIYRSTIEYPDKGSPRISDGTMAPNTREFRFSYYIDANRFRFFVPFRRWIGVQIAFYTSERSVRPENTFHVIVFENHLLDPSYVTFPAAPAGEACPRIS